MLPRLVSIADFGCAEVGSWDKSIDDGRLAHAAVAAEQRDLAFQQRTQFVDAVVVHGRYLTALIADGLVEPYHHLLVAQLVVAQLVSLVEHQDDGHAISLGRGQEAVDERGGGLGAADGDDEQRLIDVGSQDMALLREVDGLADDVVATVVDADNPALVVDLYTVADGYGIGAADAFQAEVALHLTVKKLAIVRADGVPASRILNDEAFHPIPS